MRGGVAERPGPPEQLRGVPVRGQRPGQGLRLWPARGGRARVPGPARFVFVVAVCGRGRHGGRGTVAVGRRRRGLLRRQPGQLRVVPGSDRTQPEVHHHGAVEQERIRVAQERAEAQGREEQEPGQVGFVRLQVRVPGRRKVLDGTLSLRDGSAPYLVTYTYLLYLPVHIPI